MTRETKAGLVVSCSFLCLVGVVLFYKMKEKDGTSSETADPDSSELTVTPIPPPGGSETGQRHRHRNPRVPAPPPKEAPKPAGTAGPVVPAGLQIGGDQKTTYPVPPPALPGTAQSKEQPIGPPAPPVTPTTKPTTPVIKLEPLPLPPSTKKSGPTSAGVGTIAEDESSETTFNEDPSERTGPNEQYTPKSTSQSGTRDTANELPSGVPPAQARRNTWPLFQLPPPPPAAATVAAGLQSPGTKQEVAATVPEPPKPNAAGSFSPGTPKPPDPADTRTPASDGSIAGERANGDSAPTVVSPPTADRGTPPERSQISAPAGDEALEARLRLRNSVPPPPSDQVAPAPNTPSPQASAGGSPTRPPPALGTPAAAVRPATGAPAVVPQVESYDEETYTCKPNDTFRTISRDFYQTDRYERALWLFNRNHPLATEGVRQDPPVLQPGQPVYIPPIRILERYYSGAILDSGMLAPGARPTGQAPANPQPPGSMRQVNGSAATSGSHDERIYRVQGNGEMFADIARLTLGSGERWIEIYRLNPRFNPKYPVPAGSELRLPTGARVEPVATQ